MRDQTCVDARGQCAALLADALSGLAQPRKSLPCKWLYDAAGARYFEAITRQPEYYPTRTEKRILADHATVIGRTVGPGAAVVEFGPGDGRKAIQLLQILDRPSAYVPVDIAPEWLEGAANRVKQAFPLLAVRPLVADFTRPFELDGQAVGSRPYLGFFPGSTLGNFESVDAIAFLRRARVSLRPGSQLLMGADLVKDISTLEAAYDDAAGVTAAFNLNLLERLNREVGANFDLSGFQHRARWNPQAERMEMYLVSLLDQRVMLGGKVFDFAAGECIHTENSHKYRPESLRTMIATAGWQHATMWVDAKQLFSVWLLEA